MRKMSQQIEPAKPRDGQASDTLLGADVMVDEKEISYRLMEQSLAEAEGNPMIFGERLLALICVAARECDRTVVSRFYTEPAVTRIREATARLTL